MQWVLSGNKLFIAFRGGTLPGRDVVPRKIRIATTEDDDRFDISSFESDVGKVKDWCESFYICYK